MAFLRWLFGLGFGMMALAGAVFGVMGIIGAELMPLIVGGAMFAVGFPAFMRINERAENERAETERMKREGRAKQSEFEREWRRQKEQRRLT